MYVFLFVHVSIAVTSSIADFRFYPKITKIIANIRIARTMYYNNINIVS